MCAIDRPSAWRKWRARATPPLVHTVPVDTCTGTVVIPGAAHDPATPIHVSIATRDSTSSPVTLAHPRAE